MAESSLTATATDYRTQVSGIAPDQFDSIVLGHQRRIFRVLLFYLRDADAADTLTQECFLRAYRHISRFRGESSLETWLIRIAINLARDHVKSRRRAFWSRLVRSERVLARGTADPRLSPEGILLAREEVAALWSGVESLSHKQKTVFLLRYGEEMSLDEIASVLDLDLGTVKSHLSRALGNVRRRLQGEANATSRR
jgi:RNA polymerase sigma-70 factor (ECF subfamily)